MQSIAQLGSNAATRPNSIEINQALAEEYAKEERWEEAVKKYQSLLILYPATASLFVNRIRLAAMALVISSLLILVAELIQPPLFDLRCNQSVFVDALNSTNYLISQILFLAGWIAFIAPIAISSQLYMIVTGLLIFIGGIELARSAWIQAPLQFTPTIDPTQKADS